MRTRVITALLLLLPVLPVLFVNLLWPTVVLAFLIFGLARQELVSMFKVERAPLPWLGAGLLSAAAYALAQKTWDWRFEAVIWTALAATAVGLWGCTRLMDAGKARLHLVTAELWIAAPLVSLVAIQRLGESSNPHLWRLDNWIFLATVPIWAGDTLAILVGRTFGKKLLWPALSPKKTREGSIANLFGAMAASIWLGIAMGIPFGSSVMVGLSAGILGQAGDLFESTMKRVAGVKDSGSLLPGHGGVLDRVDSILGNAAVAGVILLLSR